MLTNTKTPTRWQITLPRETNVNKRISSLMTKFSGMTLTEITKLSLILLDNQTSNSQVLDSSYNFTPEFGQYLINTKKQIDNNTFDSVQSIEPNNL